MKVMIIVPGLPLNTEQIRGGVHSAVVNLLKGFQKLAVKVRVVSMNKELENQQVTRISDNIEIVYCPEGKFGFHSMNYFVNGPSIIKKQIGEFDPDIVHYEAGNTFLLTKLFGLRNKKYLLTLHSFTLSELRICKGLKKKLNFLFNGMVQKVMNPSNLIHICKYSIDRYSSPKGKNSLIPNALNNIFFEIPAKHKTSNHILYTGVINDRKNLMLALQSIAALNKRGIHYTLTVLGDFDNEDYKVKILNYINDNGLQDCIIFKGWVSQSSVMEHFEQSDILILPSRQETLPMSIAEAMAAGKVVVASNVGGIPEMISSGKTGFTFPIHQPESLIEILATLYNNNELISRVSRQAREFAVEHYYCEAVAKKTIDYYEEILTEA